MHDHSLSHDIEQRRPSSPSHGARGPGPNSEHTALPARGLAEDIHELSGLLSSHTVHSDESVATVQAHVAHVALTLQKDINSLLFLDGETIVSLVACMQMILDDAKSNHYQIVPGHRHILRRLLIKICRETGTLPSSLFLSDVRCHSLHNIAGGSFSDIYRGEYVGETVALKRLRVFQSDPAHRASQFKAFCREALVWRQLRHPHILSFLGIDTKTFEPSGLHCMVSPWMEEGSILDCMVQRDGDMERWVLDKWVCEIAEGLDYLHSEHVVHGDLRGANILVDGNLSIKLSDFGLAKFADASTASWGTHASGALRWMAPEMLGGLSATLAADVYSFGCVCSEIYTGRRPFFHITNDAHVVVQIMKGGRPEMPALMDKFGDVLRPLIITCWNGAPSTRPVAKVLAEALRPSIIKNEVTGDSIVESSSSILGASRVSTPVSYLRKASAAADVGPSSQSRHSTGPLKRPTVFRPLQLQSPSSRSRAPSVSSFASSSSKAPEGVLLSPDWQRSPRILVVDNTSPFQLCGKKVLEDYGCIVESADDGARAMAMCDWNKTRFDLVIMRLNGASATYLIRDYDKRIPIIALMAVGATKPEDVLHNHYHLVGMNDVLPSAPSNARLLGTLEKHLFHLQKPSRPVLIVPKQEEDLQLNHTLRKRQGPIGGLTGSLSSKRSRVH